MCLTSTFIIILTSCMSCPPPEGHLHHVLYIDLLQGCPVERSATTLVTWKQYFQSLPKLMMNHSLSFWGLPQTNKQTKMEKTAPGNCGFPLPLLLKSLPPLLSLTNPQRTFAFLNIGRLSTIFTFSFNSKDSNCALNIGNCLGTPISVNWRTLLFFPDRFLIKIKKRKKIWPPFPALDWWRNEWKSQIMENVPGFIFIFFRYSR